MAVFKVNPIYLEKGRTAAQERKEAAKAKRRKNYERDQHKYQARYAVQKAIKAGVLIHPSKFKCRGQGLNECLYGADHYHHWSYRKTHWLSVIPVCSVCHARITRGTLQAPPRTLAVTQNR